ncbi:hypothetical protein GJU40_04730 [Bacillus lacus]|uniref:Uncharacterized protein n=1 Tax=Metabacillus lacus TaxID=1983721 RepID=A0A7X2LZA6_9BACI|nr:hypothetical protein [Metabacillus lacus]MRX71479.1 hypothetical protein [Metabacillus lacus]
MNRPLKLMNKTSDLHGSRDTYIFHIEVIVPSAYLSVGVSIQFQITLTFHLLSQSSFSILVDVRI